MGDIEWTISGSSNVTGAYLLYEVGYPFAHATESGCFIRPVFYLKSNVTYASGDGSKENSYRIS